MTSATYNSNLDLQLGQVPQEITDPVLYQEFLDLHNAIEQIATQSTETEESAGGSTAFTEKYRSVIEVIEDYVVQTTDRLVQVNASTGDIVIAMHTVEGYLGYTYDIKRTDTIPANSVVIIGSGEELIDEHESGVKLSTKSCYTLKATEAGWVII